MKALRRAAASLVVAGVACGPIVAALACRRGHEPSSTAKSGPSILWSVNVGTVVSASTVAVAPDGTVYVAGLAPPESPPPGYASVEGLGQLSLYAIDAKGSVSHRLPGTVAPLGSMPAVWVGASPSSAGFAVDARGGIYGLLPGGREWFYQAETGLAGPPAIGPQDQLYLGGSGGVRVLGLGAEAPAALLVPTGSRYASPPALGVEGILYFTTSHGGHLYAASIRGDVFWEVKAHTVGLPVLAPEGRLYLTQRRGISAFGRNGEPLWEFETEAPLGTPAVVAPDGTVYVATTSGLLYAVDAGQKRWTFALEQPTRWHLSVDLDGAVYAADAAGKVYCIGPDGRRRWAIRLPAPTATPVPGPDGTVYVAVSDGKLYAVSPPPGGA